MRQPLAPANCHRLEDLPNIGPAIAADLRRIGITTPEQLARRRPLDVYLALGPTMEARHYPCVLHTLLAAKHFLETGEAVPWWHFTMTGKRLLADNSQLTHAHKSS
jgi:hypothetical protein